MKCLRCPEQPLELDFGALHEAVCGRCGGRVLDATAAERVLVELCGVERSLLAELSAHFRGRLRCPACSRTLSQVPVRGVTLDLCSGCGCVFLDGGELSRLTDGRVAELRPAGMAASGADAVVGATLDGGLDVDSADAGATDSVVGRVGARNEQGWAVFVKTPLTSSDASVIKGAYVAAAFRTAIDATNMVSRAAGGIVADDCSEAEAVRLAAAFTAGGAPAVAVCPQPLQPPYRIKEARFDGETLIYPDALGRERRLSLLSLRCVSVARTRVSSTVRAGPRDTAASAPESVLRMRSSRRGFPDAATVGEAQSIKEVDREQILFDLIAADERLRIDSEGLIARQTSTQTAMANIASHIDAVAPSTTFRQRGFVALCSGERLPLLSSLRTVERELAWCLWRGARA